MKFDVEMLAFQPEFAIRTVDVPDDEFAKAEELHQRLDLVFRYGQNDFQPVANRCSVSAGDVIRIPNPKAINGEYDWYLVQNCGFHKMTGAEYEDYTDHTERRDRSFYPLVRQTGEPEVAGYWVFAIDPMGELMKWGLNGNTVFPYHRIENAEAQAQYLHGSDTHRNDTIYIVTVFNNGQMKQEEYVGE